VHLVLENNDNDAALLREGFTAQWDDDLHHTLHVLLTGESSGYYKDYATDPAAKLAQAFSEGFIYRSDFSPSLKATSFVSFLQNHDQIGNRAFGERLTVLTDAKRLEAAIALQLLAPQIPLVFMGEESGAKEPFLYFTDHRNPKLADAVREGRRREFAKFPEFADKQKRTEIPDPNAPATFERSRPSFDRNERTALYKRLLQLRREELVPRLGGIISDGADVVGPQAVVARWRFQDSGRLVLATNLGEETVTADLPNIPPIWGDATGDQIPPATTLVWILDS
jgi:maltooligosyltrehalose trehalohydrolase